MTPTVAAADTQFCTFYVAGLFVGVRVGQVQEVIRCQPITPVPLAPPFVRGLINLRGQIVPAICMRRRLALMDCAADAEPMNVVVRTADGVVSLLVDEIDEVLGVASRDHERCPDTLSGPLRDVLDGVYKLPGRLMLALDTDKLIDCGQAA